MAGAEGAPEKPEGAGDGQSAAAEGGRSMTNVPMLDLSGMRNREDAAGLRLTNIGVVLVPEEIPDLLAGARCENVGAIIPVPRGTRVEQHTGNVEIAGESLAAGDENTLLLLVGQIVVTPEVTRVGYRGVVLVGIILLPKSAQRALAGKIVSQTGQVLYYEGSAPRVFTGVTRFTKAFLELFPEPTDLVLVGLSLFAADVAPQLLASKVRSIVVAGKVAVENPDLLPQVRYLARLVAGSIEMAGGAGQGGPGTT